MIKALLLLYAIWGFNWVVMKQANAFFPPITFSCYRFLLASVVLLAVNVFLRLPVPPRRYWPWIVATGILQIAVNNGGIQMGTVSLGAGMVAVINYSMPVWMAILAYFILHEELTKRKLAGIAVCMLGLAVLMNVDTVGSVSGLVITVIAAVAWAVAGIIVKKQNQLYHGRDCTMIQYTTWQIVVGAGVLFVYSLWFEPGTVVWTPMAVACLGYNGFLASAVAFFLWNHVLTHMEAAKAGVAILGVPVVGVICGVLVLGEQLHWNSAVGMALILGGIVCIVAPKRMKGRLPVK
ncbi:DMT family transporter [uncultured Megasphaera sp.]|uniref:DMT family transporter n=1 Tax=uncultured Megasphaera sp. TaxID=165188 RepID=UPI002657CDEA|nr:EamA family transporter [uncultured Megasphaera sp.]